jgi:hypothetical protein
MSVFFSQRGPQDLFGTRKIANSIRIDPQHFVRQTNINIHFQQVAPRSLQRRSISVNFFLK